MASQQPRPPWFRISSIASRVAAPAPAPPLAPTRPPAPMPTAVRPSIPIRPPSPLTQTQEPVPPPPPPTVASPPPPAASLPPAPPAPAATPPRSPVSPAATTAAPPRSPIATPAPAATPPRSPVSPAATTAAPPRSPIATPAPAAAPPRSPAAAPPTIGPAPQSPTLTPPPATKSPQRTSPVQKATLTTSTDAQSSSSSVPTSPKTKTQVPSSSMPTSPVPKPGTTAAASGTVNDTATTPISSPKIIKPLERNPAQSPKIKPLTNPPSPLKLPPAQIKTEGEPMIEQKTMLEQQTIDKSMKTPRAHNNGIDSKGKREPTIKDTGTSKKFSHSEELGMRVITLAGENKGAVMELSPPQKKNYSVSNPQSQHRKNGTNGDQSSCESGEEGRSSNKDKTSKAMTMQSPVTTFLNSNVQGLNNSILHNCTFRYNDPGVHLSLGRSKD